MAAAAAQQPVALGGKAFEGVDDGGHTKVHKEKRRRIKHDELDIDDVLDALLKVRGRDAMRQNVDLTLETVQLLCKRALDIFNEQPILLDLNTPLQICGDIHGQYHDLLRIFDNCNLPPKANYLFLGDYVDRGKKSIETICLLFAYKIKFPENFFLLRGNHETPSISRIYGFFDECKRRYDIKLWKNFCSVFNYLPVCAVIDDKVICMHGGLSPDMLVDNGSSVWDLFDASRVPRPADIPDSGLLCDLLWSDPHSELVNFGPNDRGVSVSFGANVVENFLEKVNMDLVVRAHQVVEDGYEFFAGRRLVTIFSAPNYCGEFDNAAGILSIDEKLMCSFKVLKPDTVTT